MQKLLKECFDNVEGDYAGVGHPDWWKTGGQAGRLNAGALAIVFQELTKALHKVSAQTSIESLPPRKEAFRRSDERFMPENPGCYVLTTFLGVVLYIGLAQNLRRRMSQHLDNPQKTSPT
jgi:hypothetical protein